MEFLSSTLVSTFPGVYKVGDVVVISDVSNTQEKTGSDVVTDYNFPRN